MNNERIYWLNLLVVPFEEWEKSIQVTDADFVDCSTESDDEVENE